MAVWLPELLRSLGPDPDLTRPCADPARLRAQLAGIDAACAEGLLTAAQARRARAFATASHLRARARARPRR